MNQAQMYTPRAICMRSRKPLKPLAAGPQYDRLSGDDGGLLRGSGRTGKLGLGVAGGRLVAVGAGAGA